MASTPDMSAPLHQDFILRAIFGWLTSNQGVVVYCLIIVTAAALLYFYGFLPHARRLSNSLRTCTSLLATAATPKEFHRSFEALSADLDRDERLGSAWRRFRSSLVFPKPTDVHLAIRSTTDPELHFNAEAILEPALNLRFFAAVPNFLTGTGILGTFVGLVAGIYLAGLGLVGDEINEVKESLRYLLSGASLAFLTSIAGLACSMAFSAAEKTRLHSLSRDLDSWNGTLARLVERVTPEQVALEQVGELTRQTLQLERFNTELAVSLADSLQDRLSVNFGPVLSRLVDATEAAVKNQATVQEQLLRDLVRQFKDSFSGAAGNELTAMQGALHELNEGLSAALSGLRDGQRTLVAATSELTERLGRAMEGGLTALRDRTDTVIASLVEKLDGASASAAMSIRSSSDSAAALLTTTSAKVSESLTVMTELVASTDRLLKSHAGAAGEMTEVLGKFESVHRHLGETVKPIAEGLERLQTASLRLAATGHQILEAAKASQAAAEQLRTATSKTEEVWAHYSQRFEGIDRSLANVFNRIQEAQSAHLEQVSKFVHGIDEEHAKALESLSAVAAELLDVAESIQSAGRAAR